MFRLKSNLAALLALTLAGAAPLFGQNPTPLIEQSEDQLIATLKSEGTQKGKADACRQLAVIGTKNAVPALAALLGDEQLSHMARYGLETIPDSSVDMVLREAANKLNGRLLIGVVGSIGVRRDTLAIPLLTRLLKSSDAGVAKAAAGTLGQIGTQAAARALLEAWANLPAPHHLVLAEGLLRSAEALAAKGLRSEALAIYDLLGAAQAPHQVRAAALRGAILTRQDTALLAKALAGNDYILTAAAARTALEMPGADVTQMLVRELYSPGSPDKLVLIIQTLGRRGDPEALQALVDTAKRGAKAVRLAALRALPELGIPSAAPALVELSGDADRELSQAALEGLAGLPGKEVDTLVLAMFRSGETSKQLTAMELIGRRRMASSLPGLLQAAANADAKVRPVALKKLGELASANELPALLELLADYKQSQDLDAAEQALSAICAREESPEACAEKLTQRLAQAQPGQKCALLNVLNSIGGAKALKTVRAAVDDSNAEVHTAAIRALGTWKTVDAAPELLALAKASDNPTDKMLCLRGYFGWATQTETPAAQRLQMCQQASSLIDRAEEKKLLLGALGSITTLESLTMVTPYLDDSATREEASAATVAIAQKLLEARDNAKVATRLVAPLQKVVEVTTNTELAKRAKTLLEQAKNKAG